MERSRARPPEAPEDLEEAPKGPQPRKPLGTVVLFDQTTRLSVPEKKSIEKKVSDLLDHIEAQKPDEETTPERLKTQLRTNIQGVESNREEQHHIQKAIRATHRGDETPESQAIRIGLEQQKTHSEEAATELKTQKSNLLRAALAQHLEIHRNKIQPLLLRLVQKIEVERKQQGDPPYSNDALRMLVYEVVYGHWLWDGKGRKDGSGGYFETHLIAAAEEHIEHGFTSLARILSALKHDDFEDLEIHHVDFNLDKATQVNPDWVFCDDLYEPELEGTLSNGRSSRDYLVELKPKIIRTVRAVTKPDTEEKAKDPLSKKLQDEAALIRFFESLLEEGHAGPLKILEQVHNMKTLDGLKPERRGVKGASILKNWGILAQVLALAGAHHVFVEKGMELYCPEVKGHYESLQTKRIAARLQLGKGPEKQNSRFWRVLGGEHWRDLKYEAQAELEQDALTQHQRKTRQRLGRLGHRPEKGRGIVKIEIRPTPIENHINIPQLLKDREAFKLEITPEDPLFEVNILTRTTEQTAAVLGEMTRRAVSEGVHTKTTHTPQGILLLLACEEGEIKIRIQTESENAKTKRGKSEKRNRGNATNAIPETLRSQIREALRVAKDHGRPILEVIDEIVLAQTMDVVAWNGTRRERVTLPLGSTARDLAAHLPTKVAEELLLDRAPSAEITRFTGGGGYSRPIVAAMESPLEPGDLCRIQTSGDTLERIDPGTLVFCKTPEVRLALRRQLNAKAAETGQKHLEALAGIMGHPAHTIATLCLHRTHNAALGQPFAPEEEIRLRELESLIKKEPTGDKKSTLEKERTPLEGKLHRKIPQIDGRSRRSTAFVARYVEKRFALNRKIGLGEIDPLQALAPYVTRKAGITLRLLVEDRPGMLVQILSQWITPKGNINIETNDTTKNSDGTQWVELTLGEIPEGISNHELLKLILRFRYIQGIQSVTAGPTDQLFELPSYLTPLINTAKTIEEPTPRAA